MSISVHEGCVTDFLDSVVAKAIGESGDTALDPETMIKNAELFSSQAAEAISVSDSVPKEQETIEEIEGETQPGEPALAGEEAGEGAGGGARAGGGAGEVPAAGEEAAGDKATAHLFQCMFHIPNPKPSRTQD
jgi:hypothetical protein